MNTSHKPETFIEPSSVKKEQQFAFATGREDRKAGKPSQVDQQPEHLRKFYEGGFGPEN